MDMTGSRRIMAPRDQVWTALTSAEVLKVCIPGCETMTGSVEVGYQASVTHKLGPVKARVNGAITLSNLVPGERYTITGQAQGDRVGGAGGSADIVLNDIEGGTQLDYAVTATVEGKLAQLGSRVIDRFARRMADGFFERFQLAVEGPIEPAAPADVTDEGAERKASWIGWLIGKTA